MTVDYPSFMPAHMRYRSCPMCTGALANVTDLDGLTRYACGTCGWVYYPCNLQGVVVVITTAEDDS